ncbi:MAG: hypothetical protein DKM50_06640 [Candidatus Margulisiibacteriota bacterium]|nr:MAG: hypothetical protein DKM50_06640 [Candidatus Margulisiibacteriota bacterium]HAR62764.1 hypothetical protein [Candidatus Margulisiibacteriota bacterium]HCY37477.1 hypothetical protein [Candidatus Margulisiibacteriota bacterium]
MEQSLIMKKIFGTISTYEFDGVILGRKEADKNFLYSLLSYSSFDEFHIFLLEPSRKQYFIDHTRTIVKEFGLENKLKFFDIYDLVTCIKTCNYTVFHCNHLQMDSIFALRNNLHPKPLFPITGFTHTLINYQQSINLFHNLIYRPKPFDCIICSSTAGEQVIQKAFNHLSNQFGKSFGQAIPYEGKTRIIPIGVATSLPRIPDAKMQLGLPEQTKVILCLGRISFLTKMDLQPLLLVFSKIARLLPETLLIIAGGIAKGDEGCLDYLKILSLQYGIENNIIVKTNVSDDEKQLLYSASDIYVSPSDHTQETFGVTIIEAMAAGLPVVATDWNGYKDLIVEGETGFRIPTYWTQEDYEFCKAMPLTDAFSYQLNQQLVIDLDIFEQKLLYLLNNPDEVRRMGNKGKTTAAQKYNWQNIIQQHEELWSSLKEEAIQYHNDDKDHFFIGYPVTEVFSHYSTRNLDYSDYEEISLTPYALEALTKSHDLIISPPLRNYLKPDIINKIVLGLNENQRPKLLLEEIEKTYQKAIIVFNVQWLLKKGILKI